MLSFVTGNRRHRFDDVHPIHRLTFFVPMSLGVGGRHRKETRESDSTQKIPVQGENHIRILKLVLHVQVVAKTCFRRSSRTVSGCRIVLD